MPTTSPESPTPSTDSSASPPWGPRVARGALVAGALLLCASSLSCSLLIDVSSKQCSVDADCTKLGDEFKGSTCQSNVCVTPTTPNDPLKCPTQFPSGAPTVKFTFKVTAAGGAPKSPFSITACDRIDLVCDPPQYGTKQVANGDLVQLDLPTNFNGYLNVLNPDLVQAQLYLGQPLTHDTVGWDLTIPTEATLKLLTSSVGHSLDRTAGMLIVIARDCARGPLDGVTFSNTAGGIPFYFMNMFPYPDATETLAEGAGGFINIPLGTTIVSAVHNASMHKLQDSGALLKSGWITYMEIFP